MDYWYSLDVHHHADWAAFRASEQAPKRLWLFTTKATQVFWDAEFADGDGLVFGNEGHGSPDWLHEEVSDAHRVTLPQYNPELRSPQSVHRGGDSRLRGTPAVSDGVMTASEQWR